LKVSWRKRELSAWKLEELRRQPSGRKIRRTEEWTSPVIWKERLENLKKKL
jgi:hypothetical protein